MLRGPCAISNYELTNKISHPFPFNRPHAVQRLAGNCRRTKAMFVSFSTEAFLKQLDSN